MPTDGGWSVGQECSGGGPPTVLPTDGGWSVGQSVLVARRPFCPLMEVGQWAGVFGRLGSGQRGGTPGLSGPGMPAGEAPAEPVLRRSRRTGARRRRRAGSGRCMNRRPTRSGPPGRRSAAPQSDTGRPPGFPAGGTGADGPELSFLQPSPAVARPTRRTGGPVARQRNASPRPAEP
jgi:hypothetical protein